LKRCAGVASAQASEESNFLLKTHRERESISARKKKEKKTL